MLEHLQPLIRKSIARSYGGGSTILYQGEVPRTACIIKHGVVRVYSISSQGDEQIVAFHVAGEFFPSTWIFQKSTSSMFFYEAVTDCEIVFTPKEELISFMMAEPKRTTALLDYFTTNYVASLVRISALEQPKAREKLLYTLYFLCQRYGRMGKGLVEINLSLTHQNLASLVGVTRETTATEMSQLKKQKILTYDNQKYTVDVEKLLNLIGEESFRGVKISS